MLVKLLVYLCCSIFCFFYDRLYTFLTNGSFLVIILTKRIADMLKIPMQETDKTIISIVLVKLIRICSPL